MDLFCEYLVKKKSVSDTLKRVTLICACIIICIAAIYVSFFVKRDFISFMPIFVAAVIFGTVILSRNFSLEYEYVFTNGVLDIDIIKGRAKRKPLISVPCRKIEYMGPVKSIENSQNKIVNAIYNEKRLGIYIVTFSNQGEKTDLYFQPPEKLIMNMQKYNPRNIHM